MPEDPQEGVTENVTGGQEGGAATEAPPEPQEGQQPQEPEAPQEQPGLQDQRDAARSARERGRQVDERARQHRDARQRDTGDSGQQQDGPPRDASGRFAPKEEGAEEGSGAEGASQEEPAGQEAGGEQEGDATAAEERASDEGDADAPESPADERGDFVRVELEEDHPLRDSGVTEITVADEKSAEAVRALKNGTYTRRAEVEALRERERQLREQLQEWQKRSVQSESTQSALAEFQNSEEYPQYVQRYQEIKQTVGNEAASEYWKGHVNQRFQEFKDRKFQENWGEVEQQREQEAAEAWKGEAKARLSNLPAEVREIPEFGQWFDEEVDLLEYRLQKGHVTAQGPEDLHQAFRSQLMDRLAREPKVRELWKSRTAAQNGGGAQTASAGDANGQGASQGAADAGASGEEVDPVEEYKRDAAERRRETPPNPLGGAGQAAGGGPPPPGEDGQLDARSPSGLKRQANKRARQRSHQYFGQ